MSDTGNELLRRAWYLLRRRQADDDLAEEMDFHRDMKARELEARGLDADSATFAARRAFGVSMACFSAPRRPCC